jgi:hypothetical protein
MNRLSIAALLVVLLFSLACSNLKKTTVTEENKRELMSRIAQGNEVTNEERHLLVEYSLRYNLAVVLRGGRPDLPTGKTIGEMIEEQRKWDAQQAQTGNTPPQPQPGH